MLVPTKGQGNQGVISSRRQVFSDAEEGIKDSSYSGEGRYTGPRMLEATLNSCVMYENMNSKARKASGPGLYQKGPTNFPTGSPHDPWAKPSPSSHNALLTLTPAEGRKTERLLRNGWQSLGLESTNSLWMANEYLGSVWLNCLSFPSMK